MVYGGFYWNSSEFKVKSRLDSRFPNCIINSNEFKRNKIEWIVNKSQLWGGCHYIEFIGSASNIAKPSFYINYLSVCDN